MDTALAVINLCYYEMLVMTKRIRRHFKTILPLKKPVLKEALHTQEKSVLLNRAGTDRISFSVLRNDKNQLRKIENISYEVNIKDKWEWVARYDDHGGAGLLHRHVRVSLQSSSDVESSEGIKKYKNKDHELAWVFKDIKRNYWIFRSKFLKNSGLDLY